MKVEHLKVGVIGLGMGRAHLAAAIEYGAEIGLICDLDPAKLEKWGKENNVPEEKWTKDYKDIINDESINVVIIATPDQQHRQQIVECLEAGKHVMCEKPLALTREDNIAIVEAVKAHPECKFMVGQICRYTPSFVLAKQYIDEGKLGDLYYVESEYAHDYIGMFEANPTNWRSDPDRNGVVGGGCHAVDLLRWLVDADPEEVYAYGTHKLLPMVSYDDANLAIMKFPGNVMGKVFVSTGCKRDYTMRTCVYGTKGTMIFTNREDPMKIFLVDEKGHAPHEPTIIEPPVNNHNAVAEFRAFAECLVNDTPVETTVFEGAKTVEVCLSIVESANEHKLVNPDYSFCK